MLASLLYASYTALGSLEPVLGLVATRGSKSDLGQP